MEYIFIGVDPGIAGGIAALDEQKNLLYVANTPLLEDGDYNCEAMLELLQRDMTKTKRFICIEKPIAFPGQNSVATLSTGIGFGIWYSLAKICSLAVTAVVQPNIWTKAIIGDRPKLTYADRKKDNAKRAKIMFPDVWKPTTMKEVMGQADALLIASYCRMTIANELKLKHEKYVAPKPVEKKKSNAVSYFLGE